MTGSRCLTPVLFTVLAIAAGTASARDPAFVGGSSRSDPANLSSRTSRQQARSAPSVQDYEKAYPQFIQDNSDPNSRPMSRDEVARQIQGMMGQLENNLTSSTRRSPYDRSQQRQYSEMLRQTQTIMSRNGNQFTPSTKAVFLELQALDEQQRRDIERRENLPPGDPNVALDRGMVQAEQGMRRLNDVLLPMLQDIKRAVDTELRNGANRR
jgi:hypothetical protein